MDLTLQSSELRSPRVFCAIATKSRPDQGLSMQSVISETSFTVLCQDSTSSTASHVVQHLLEAALQFKGCCCATLQCFPVVRCGLLYMSHVTRTAFGRVMECDRVKCAEKAEGGRRWPM